MTTEVRHKLAYLGAIQSQRRPIITVYVNLGAGFTEARSISARLKNLLEPLEARSDRLGHVEKLAVRETVERILSLEPRIAASRDKCVAIFMGGEPAIEEFLVLPRKTWDVAVADVRPYLRPLRAALDSFHNTATVVVDPRRSEIWVTDTDDIVDHAVVESEPVRKADFAGWHGLDEHRTRNHAEEVIARHFKEVEERLVGLDNRYRLDVVYIGGRDETAKAFVSQLSEPIQNLVVDTFVVDVHTATPAIVANLVSQLEQRYERRQELEQVGRILDTARGGGLATIGVANTLSAVNQGAIDHLLVYGPEMEPGWACSACGWLNADGAECPGCGGVAQPVIDILELLVARTVEQGASVRHVTSATELDDHRVAARLRFPPVAATH